MSLTDQLRQIDRDKSLPNHPEVKRIQRNVENVVKEILEHVQKQDERFQNKLLRVGSYYDGLKVGLPDEFDYLVELTYFVEHENFEVQPAGFRGTRNLWRTPDGHRGLRKVSVKNDSQFCIKCFEDESTAWEWLTQVGTKEDPEYVLNSDKIKHMFFEFVLKALEHIKATSTPKFIEILDETTVMHGPAVTLAFKWKGRAFKNLKISIDMTICFKVKDWENCLNVLDQISCYSWLRKPLEFILTEDGCHLTPFKREAPTYCKRNPYDMSQTHWRISTSYIENRIMCLLPADLHVKLLIRVIKITRDSEPCLSAKLPLLALIDNPSLAKNKEFIRLCEGLPDLLPSYLIKTVGLMLLSEVSLAELRRIPLSNLYIFTLCNLYRLIADKCIENFFISGYKLNTPVVEDIFLGFYSVFQMLKVDDISPQIYSRTNKTSGVYTQRPAFAQNNCPCECRSNMINLKPESLKALLADTKSNLQSWYGSMFE